MATEGGKEPVITDETVPLNEDTGKTIRVYPSDEMKASFITDKPKTYATVIAMVFLFQRYI